MAITASRLIELAERVEQASGPDRGLDGEIEVARDPMRETILYSEPGRFPQKSVRGPIKDLCLTGRDLADYVSAPDYTISLDAAMSMVPEGQNFGCGDRDATGRAWAWVGLFSGPDVISNAATPALALTAACLRALAQGEK